MSGGPLNGRCALVTGSTSGIGLGIATALAARGAAVAVTGLGSKAQIDDALQAIREHASAAVTFFDADLREPQAIEQMIAAVAGEFSGLDILVNNAGIQHVAPVHEFPVAQWDAILAINLSAAFHTIRGAVPHMQKKGWGRIVNVASAHALVASPYKSAYVAAKHGIAGLTKTVALELATQNITVNAVAPGYVHTPLVAGQVAATAKVRGITEQEVIENVMLAAQPTRRFVEIEQVAAMVTYLCSDDASAVTGTVLPIDGGWSAQ